MTMGEIWGWMEAFYRELGVWDTMGAALSIVVVISLASFGISMLRR